MEAFDLNGDPIEYPIDDNSYVMEENDPLQQSGLCVCGSGEPWERLYDVQGIYVSRVCSKCETEVKSHYRPEIFSGYTQADIDEPIEED